MPRALLATGALAMFAASASGTAPAPFLLEMARDRSTSMPLVADFGPLTAAVALIGAALALFRRD